MRISLPLVWLVPFFIFGLLIGRQFPSVVYLWLAAVALLAAAFTGCDKKDAIGLRCWLWHSGCCLAQPA